MDGVSHASLEADPAEKAAFIDTVEEAILSVLNDGTSNPVTRDKLTTTLSGTPAEGALRRLQESGDGSAESVWVSTLVDPSAPVDRVLFPKVAIAAKGEVLSRIQARYRITTTTVPAEARVAELLNAVDNAKSASLDALAGGATNVSVELPGGGQMVVAKLDSLAEGGLEQGGMKVELPKTFFSSAEDLEPPVPGDELAFVAATVGGETAKSMGGEAAVVMDLQWLSGPKVRVKGLEEPVEFSMPQIYDDVNMQCKYWNEELKEWSTDGVQIHPDVKLGDKLKCTTVHFSLFGAILQGFVATLLCANFDLLNAQSISQLFKGDWYASSGSFICGGLLSLFAVMFGIAIWKDWHRRSRFKWSDEYFLVAKPDINKKDDDGLFSDFDAASEDGDPEGDPFGERYAQRPSEAVDADGNPIAEKKRESVLQRTRNSLASANEQVNRVCPCHALKEALDDICASWFEYFGQVRTCCEEICSGVSHEILHPHPGCVAMLSNKMVTQLLLMSSRRSAAASLNMNQDLVNFILEDEDFADFLMEESRKIRSEEARTGKLHRLRTNLRSQRSAHWREHDDQYTAWYELRNVVCEALHSQANKKHTRLELAKSIGWTFMLQNPIGDLYAIDIFKSCKQKVAVLFADFMGALVLCTVFFQGSGMVRGKPKELEEMCNNTDSDIGNKIGRFLAIATVSIFLAGMPVHILESLQTKGFKVIAGEKGGEAWRQQLRAWKIQEAMFWGMAVAYNGFCTLYLLVFLANISPEDHTEWSFTGMLSMIEDFVAMPLIMASVMPILSKVWLYSHSKATGTSHETLVRRACEHLHKKSNMMLPIEGV